MSTETTKPAMTTRADKVIADWEASEGESMREGHAETLTRLIAAALEAERRACEELACKAIDAAFEPPELSGPRDLYAAAGKRAIRRAFSVDAAGPLNFGRWCATSSVDSGQVKGMFPERRNTWPIPPGNTE